MSLFAPCVKRVTWTVSFFALLRGGQSRMHLNSASTRLFPRAFESASLADPSFCEICLSHLRCIDFCCLLRGFRASPARVFPCSPHVRAFTCSEASLPTLPRSCVCWSLLCGAFRPLPWSSWSIRAPSLCTNLFWTLRCCLEHL